ncbi:hypothetical protein, partial [Paraburkholderia sp. SIMBA_030]
PMVDIVAGATKKVFDAGLSFVGHLFTGSTGGPMLFDNGGWLEQTAQPLLVQHRKTKPDAVLSNGDWQALHRTSQAVSGLT